MFVGVGARDFWSDAKLVRVFEPVSLPGTKSTDPANAAPDNGRQDLRKCQLSRSEATFDTSCAQKGMPLFWPRQPLGAEKRA